VAVALALLPVADHAAASTLAGGPLTVVAPPDAAARPSASLAGVASWSGSACVAVGGYVSTSTRGEPMVAAGTVSRWRRATTIAVPADRAAAHSVGSLAAVACPAARTCVAVGSYESAAPAVLPVVATDVGGTWGPATPIVLPVDAGPDQLARLTSVACPAVGACVAVGTYVDTRGVTRLLAATETAGTWGAATPLALPPGAGDVPRTPGTVGLAGVACTAIGSCVAVGDFLDAAGSFAPLRIVESSGAWGAATRVPVASGDGAPGPAVLRSVACGGPGWCVAVGWSNGVVGWTPIVSTEAAGRWGAAVPIGYPPGFGHAVGGFTAVACTAPSSCTAVGWLRRAGAADLALVGVDVRGRWQPLTAVAARQGRSPSLSLGGVACPVANRCVAVGADGTPTADGEGTDGRAVAVDLVPIGPSVVPAPPHGVTARPRPDALLVSWRTGPDGGAPIASYTATATPGGATCTASVDGCRLVGLTNGASYTVAVTATNVRGPSRPSAPSAPAIPGTVPSVPTGVRVRAVGDRVAVRWRASLASGDPVTAYVVVARGLDGAASRCTSPKTRCILVAPTATTYAVQVTARNAVGSSRRSRAVRLAVR
jgi:hypothetical protein